MVSGHERTELLEIVRSRYPTPIAEAARKWQVANDGSRANAGLALGKALIVTLASISIAWCRSQNVLPGGVQGWYLSLKRQNPSLGKWAGAARSGAQMARENGAELSGFAEALGDLDSPLWDEIQALVGWRNQYGGAGGGGQKAGPAKIREFEAHLLAALRHADCLRGTRFALIERSQLQRKGGYLISFKEVVGDNSLLMPGTFEYPANFFTPSVYLLVSPGQDLEITPLWDVPECDECLHQEICYLERARRDEFEYVSFTTNHRFRDRNLPRDFPWFTQGLQSLHRYQHVAAPTTLAQPRRPVREHQAEDKMNLADLYRQTQSSMLRTLRVDVNTGWKGWNRNLEVPGVTAFATATGLRIMRIVGDEFSPFRSKELVETLWGMQVADGVWSYTTQVPTGRPEATAAVLLALWLYDDWERITGVVPGFEHILQPQNDDMLWRHVFSLASAAPALATVAPTSKTLEALVDTLRDSARHDEDGMFCWTRLTCQDPGFRTKAVPSAAHTARTVLALLHCFQATDGRVGVPPDRLEPATQWLLRHPDWSDTLEHIHRPYGKGTQARSEDLATRHCTSAWVVRALLELDADPTDQRIVSSIAELYRSHRDGLWDWGAIRAPVWATLDALRALQSFSQRVSPLAT